ncbi:MAG: hypothetical protein IJ007_01375 [Oscillospiraceae bacterium]|nr:hypothetical protein [Oscillospiraceae bacterium]
MMKVKEKKIFKWTGVMFTLIGIVLIALSIFYIAAYDKVEGELYVTKKKSGKKAYITYEYDSITYEDKALSSYNAFTMKNGKTCTVYISSDSPDEPKATNFGLGVFTVLSGIFALKAGSSDTENDI